jgi:hypothetical protein
MGTSRYDRIRGIAAAAAMMLLAGCAESGDDQTTCDGSCADASDAEAAEAGDGIGDADSHEEAAGDDLGPEDAEADAADGVPCIPTESVEVTCNRIDDDCDGVIDDVDLGADGICDCLGVLLLGDPGPRASAQFVAWLESRGTTAQRRVDSSGGPLTAADLLGIDVVILDRLSRDYDAGEVEALQAYVRSGGGLISMTGYDWRGPDATRPNGIIAGLGARYDASVHLEGSVNDFDAAHPIMAGINAITFEGGYPVVPIDGFDTAVVARLDGTPVGVAVELGDGRVFVWGDEWIEYDSEWASMPTVPRLWANLLGWLVPKRCTVPIL